MFLEETAVKAIGGVDEAPEVLKRAPQGVAHVARRRDARSPVGNCPQPDDSGVVVRILRRLTGTVGARCRAGYASFRQVWEVQLQSENVINFTISQRDPPFMINARFEPPLQQARLHP